MRTLYKFLRAGVVSALFVQVGFAQKENVGIGTTKPDQSAILDLSSTNKGLLMPRVTLQQRNSIQNPANGLIVYQTDMLSGFYYYDGKDWKSVGSETAQNSVADAVNWGLTGNAGTSAATNFIGTTDNVPFVLKTNNVQSGKIDPVSFNLALGYQALLNATTADNNTAIGKGALKTISNAGGGNLAVGALAMENSGAAIQNVGIGEAALQNNGTGLRNTAVGRGALQNSGNSQYNIALGFEAGRDATTSNNVYIGTYAGIFNTQSNKLYIHSSTTPTNFPLIGGDFDSKFVKIHTGTAAPTATAGFVAIGDFETPTGASAGSGGINTFPNFTAGSQYRLVVQNGIITEKLKVALRNSSDWADYVFAPEYKLMPLDEVEKFTLQNKHLPNVPSAEDMAKEGLDFTQTSSKLMEKIEELTLYLIDINKQVKELKDENAKLKITLQGNK